MESERVNSKTSNAVLLLVMVSMGFGIWSRFQGLGTWSLAVDEFYIAKAVEFIRDSGIPVFPDGGIYKRALLFLYVEALSTWIWGFNEFALRVPAVLFNLACLPALFLLAKKRTSCTAALLLISAFTLSVWEIEFSRFARMYSAFQCAFIWFLYFYHEGFLEGRERFTNWAYWIAAVSVFIYIGAIFMVLFLFLAPAFAPTASYNKLRHWAISGLILGLNYLFNYTNLIFSVVGSTNNLPAGFQNINPPVFTILSFLPHFISLPDFALLRSLFHVESIWLIIFSLLAISGTVLSFKFTKAKTLNWRIKSVFLFLVVLSLSQLYGVAAFILLLALLSQTLNLSHLLKAKIGRYVLALLSVTFLFWLSLGLFTTEWQSFTVMGDQSYLRKLFALLLHYPRVGERVLFLWADVMPLTIIITGLFFIGGLLLTLTSQHSTPINFTLLVITISLFFLGFFNTMYSTTRYSFFLYPVVLLLWFEVARALGFWIFNSKSPTLRNTYPIFILAPFLLFLTTEDFSFSHLRDIDKARVNFRIKESEKIAAHYYKRQDYKSPAEYVNQRFADGDLIINVLAPVTFYLRPQSYFYYDENGIYFTHRSIEAGTRERWTNLPLVYNHEMLLSLFDRTKGTIWMIEGENAWERTGWIVSPYVSKNYDVQLAQTSIDDRINVFRITRNKVQL